MSDLTLLQGPWQDNVLPHVARVCRHFLEDKVNDAIEWPTPSPDLNPIEDLWGYVLVHPTNPTTSMDCLGAH